MENAQKALIMAGSVFMFVIAVSVGIYSYNVVREINNSILTSSERYSTTAESFIEAEEDIERYATRAEVIMAIYAMKDMHYSPDEINVNGKRFFKEQFSSISGEDDIESKIQGIADSEYSISYNFANNKVILIYSPVS